MNRRTKEPTAVPAPASGRFALAHLPVLIALAAIVLFAGAATRELHGTPTFYGSLVRELVESGDPMVIFRGADAYFLKPPLVLWLTALSTKLFGLTSLGATFASRLAGFACVLLVYALGRRLGDAATGWFAAIVLVTNSTFVQFTTTLRMDSLMLAGMLLSTLGWCAPDRRWGSAALFGGITIAVLAKGPLGLLPLALFALDALVRRRAPRPPHDWRFALLLLPIPAWYATLLLGFGAQPLTDLASDLVRPDPVAAASAWRSYADNYLRLPALRYWPWLPFMLLGLWHAIRPAGRATDDGMRAARARWLAGWVLLVLVLCAFKPDRDIRYLYPALPALALLAGLALARLVRGAGLCWALGLALAAAVTALIGGTALGWGSKDTRPAIAAMREASDALRAAGGWPAVLGEYPIVPGAPRRQNNQRDWVHYYLGVVPRIVSWSEALAGGLQGEPLVLTLRSAGYEERLDTLGFEPKYVTKEMVLGLRR